MKQTWLVIPLACALTATAGAQDRGTSAAAVPTEPPPVEVRTAVSRTAVWVGDPVIYIVELRCQPKVDILADDLSAERLPLKGMELRSVDVERDATDPERLVHRMRYELVTYEVDVPELGVGAIPVRYYIRQPGMRAEDVVPAGEVEVPPLALSLRSTIPEGSIAALRDARAMQPLPSMVRLAKPLGIAFVLLAIAPVALAGVHLARRARQARPGGRVRQTRKQRLAALEEIKALDVSSAEALRQAYDRLDAWIRSGLQQTTGVPALALTPVEIGTAVTHPPRSVRIEQVQEVLAECERAKYAPEPPRADRWDAILAQAEQAMGADAR